MSGAGPLVLLGAHRSGTTWLGELLGSAPELAYWAEPRQVWSYGHWFRADDRLVAADASPAVRRYIRRRFADFVRSRGAQRLCEKTPSNCLRIPFVAAVFPEASFVMIERDGRSVLGSVDEQRRAGPSWARIRQRLRESSWRDLPAFVSRTPWLAARIAGRPLPLWGVRPPGWRGWVREDPPMIAQARQWAACVQIARDDFESLPQSQTLLTSYERLVTDPAREMRRIAEFAAVRDPDTLVARAVATARPEGAQAWRNTLDVATLAAVRPILEPVMTRLGYRW